MTLRNIRINLREEDITDHVFVMTKKINTEIDIIIKEILSRFHKGIQQQDVREERNMVRYANWQSELI